MTRLEIRTFDHWSRCICCIRLGIFYNASRATATVIPANETIDLRCVGEASSNQHLVGAFP